jgi:alkanesulfonate monooxygenase SsuD/methylene tetrahydromethanopterin reductase-like flavin-dependent oxidoreductase (luciferase family)
MIGVVIQAPDARSQVEQVKQAEAAGIPAVWAISGRGPDLIPAWAAAAVQTERILLGTSIVRTWTRHPIGFAMEALAIEQLAPGRFRLGIGTTARGQAEQMYGARFDKPLTHLREYLTTIRSLLHTGEVDFVGEYVTARTSIGRPVQTPVMAAAAGLRAFELCGEASDGAISWGAPRSYLVGQALPALRRGAERAGRTPPPIVAHVPIAVSDEAARARTLAREQLAGFASSPHFTGTWAAAGYDVAAGYSDRLLDDLLVWGNERQVADGLVRWIEAGMGEVLAQPLLDPEDITGSIARAFAAVARAQRALAGR